TTGAIIAIVVIALIVIALLAFVVPRMRAKSEMRKRERELHMRRERAVEEQRAEASARETRASEAEQRARVAAPEAEAERAGARRHEERAGMHERGMADHELIDESERDRFSGVADRDGERPEATDHERPARFTRDDETAADPPRRDEPTRYQTGRCE